MKDRELIYSNSQKNVLEKILIHFIAYFKNAEIEEFEENFIKFINYELSKIDIIAEKLAKGLPASYTNSKGRFMKEYPNGKQFLIKYNKKTKFFKIH